MKEKERRRKKEKGEEDKVRNKSQNEILSSERNVKGKGVGLEVDLE